MKINEFRKELKALLKKYNVTIGASISGDTHGIYNEKIIVQPNGTDKEYTLTEYSLYLTHRDL